MAHIWFNFVWKHLTILHDNYDSHSTVRQDDGLLWQGDTQLSRTRRTNLLPPSPDCSLLDGEIRFFRPLPIYREFISSLEHGSLGLQMQTKDSVHYNSWSTKVEHTEYSNMLTVKYKSFKNQFQATAVKSNRLFIYYKLSSPGYKTFICSVKLDEGRKSKWNQSNLLIPYTLHLWACKEYNPAFGVRNEVTNLITMCTVHRIMK